MGRPLWSQTKPHPAEPSSDPPPEDWTSTPWPSLITSSSSTKNLPLVTQIPSARWKEVFLIPTLANPSSAPLTSTTSTTSSDPTTSTNDALGLRTLDLNDPTATLPNCSSSPCQPPLPAPISQLMRMMTPLITPLNASSSSSTKAWVFLHPLSSTNSKQFQSISHHSAGPI
ncbi:hypothetical protein PGT21_017005 [Puccinia graminis f. sp. tritici]|uniref:Uncharacterized protein n=1 Tax=Puccinia graminis f. sp. tritici TaxID=56615 RepID=A0A5B0QWP3_PUCGR|nr:hypothetical protein PGT21_017005 [Puccinia graminis f. sp. tritici]